MECPKCHTRTSGGARLCRNCGGPLPEEVEAKKAPPATPVVPPRADGASWVRVRCTYQCAGCKSRVPLFAFAEDGQSECSLCGHVQEHALLFWRQVLKHAHRCVGLTVAELEDERVREDEDTAGDLVAGPGRPTCLGCSAPIDDSWKGGDATCSCGVTVHGVKPAKAMPIDRGLVAILRRTPIAAKNKGAVVALRCPTCDAPLTVAGDATRVTCKFCQTTSALAAPAAPTQPAAAETVTWMLFAGPAKRA